MSRFRGATIDADEAMGETGSSGQTPARAMPAAPGDEP